MSYEIRAGLRARVVEGGRFSGYLFPTVEFRHIGEGIEEIHSLDDVVEQFRQLFNRNNLRDDPAFTDFIGYLASMRTTTVERGASLPAHPYLRPPAGAIMPRVQERMGEFFRVAGVQLTTPEFTGFVDYALTNTPVESPQDLRISWIEELSAPAAA